MDWFLIIILICVVLFLIANSTANQEMQREKQINEQNGTLYKDSTMKYLGGFPTIASNKKCTLELKENSLTINIEEYGNRIISLKNISDIRIISKEQLQKKINLGKLVVFGFYALAFQDTKIVTNDFLQIQYNNGNEDLTLIFVSEKLENTCRRLRSAMNI